jgi:repressor LexA
MKVLDEKTLTNILTFISTHQKERGISPSYRSIQQFIKATSLSVVHRYINELKTRGLLAQETSGSIYIDPRLASKKTTSVPLLGYVTCGSPILVIENIEGSYPLPSEIFGDSDLFMLMAKGTSMIGAGIRDGDILVIKKQSFASPEDIVVALLGEEATVKRYRPTPTHIILHPENPNLQDIIVKECQIIGKVVSFIHRFGVA